MPSPSYARLWSALLTALLFSSPVHAQEDVDAPSELSGKLTGVIDESFKIEANFRGSKAVFDARLMRPVGKGPFPLAVIMHGGITDYVRRSNYRTGNYSSPMGEFVRRGWAAVTFLRLGYGTTGGEPVEFVRVSMQCEHATYEQPLTTVAEQTASVIDALRRRPDIDPSRVVAMGISYGGAGALALSTLPVDGLKAVVAFASGAGSNEHGQICNRSGLFSAIAQWGRAARVPSLWISAENDRWIPPDAARGMFAAFANEKAQILFTPPSGEDGHPLMMRRQHVHFWSATFDSFLRRHNLPTWAPNVITPAAIGIRDNPRNVQELAKYLTGANEKAIAVSPKGGWWFFYGQTSTEDARKKAMASCEKVASNAGCRIAAVNFELPR